MRLIKYKGHGNFGLVEPDDNNIPPYAILSHTWGVDGEEVLFKDLMEGTGKSKAGYNKIEFCRKQAASDGLQFFWVDTCCIDKSSSAELNEAINSMFRWYENAVKCYVYLSDVCTSGHATTVQSSPTTWEAAFQRSRWFRRGWTLQELIAPASVDFFSRQGDRLGSKRSLEQQIHDITKIAIGALRGGALTDFEVEERLSWANHRETKRQEDKVYSLLGIFNIHMPLIYGEGREKAFMRLRNKIGKSSKRKWDSYVETTPFTQDTSQDYQLLNTVSHIGDAAYDSYENQRHRPCLTNTRVDLLREITDWATCNSSQYIFWLKGRAGTGKSTIALTIAQSLDKQGVSLASFFFKRGGGDLARSRKVISTIAFQLAIRSRPLASFICEALRNYPNLGDSASLSQQYDKLLLRPLQRARQSATGSPSFVIVLDALDECDDFDDVDLLLRLLGNAENMKNLGLRVLVTSRPEIPIRLGFQSMQHVAYQELALHDVSRVIVDQDIKNYITHEFAKIKAERNLPDCWPGDDKIRTITSLADGLFIYAATVCRYVHGPRQVSVSARLEQVCQGSGAKHKSTRVLDDMYLMVLDSSMKDDFSAEEAQEVAMRLQEVVGSVVLLSDSLSAEELARLLFPTVPTGIVIVQQTLDSLHALFDVPDDLRKPIQMLHLSFRDFLVDSARCPDVRFHIKQQQVHYNLSDRCLSLMEQYLIRNMCQLSGPGVFVNEVSEPVLRQYLPFGLKYACRHWVSHAENGRISLSDNGSVHNFLRQYCLYWIEVMSLISKIPEAITMMIQLKNLIKAKKAPKLYFLVQDILRFIRTFSYMLSKAPLQLYSAGLIFSPTHSVFRRSFGSQASVDFKVRPQPPPGWNGCIQTLEGHSDFVNNVAFSPDGSRVASGSDDKTVRVWDVQTGQCQHTLEGHSDSVYSVVFSPDGSRVASGSGDKTVRVWDVQTGQCQHTLEGHSDFVRSVVFSPDGSRVASGSGDKTVRVWDVQTGQCQHTLEGHSDFVNSVVFSPDGSRVASGSGDKTVRVWDVQTGQCQHTLEGHSGWVRSVVFSPDGSRVASGSGDKTVRVWDVQTGQCQHTLEGHSGWVNSVVFSPDGSRVASGSDDKTVRVWDVQTGQCQHTLEGHSGCVNSVVFSPDGSRVASGSDDKTVRVWDVQTGQCQHTLEGHSGWVNSVVFSPDGSRVASGSNDKTVRVWDVQTGQCQHTLEGHSGCVNSVVFSPDGSRVASGSDDKTVRVWDVQTGQCQHTLEGHSGWVRSVVFSPDGSRVASGSNDKTVRVWDVQTGQCQHTLEGHSGWVRSVVFSPDGSRVASGSGDKTVRAWDVASSTELLCYDTGTFKNEIEFSDDNMKIVVNGDLLPVPSQTRVAGTAAGSPGPSPNLPVGKLSIRGDWVTSSSERILWIPPEYRPGEWASNGDTIVMGSGNGRVTFVHYAATHFLSS